MKDKPATILIHLSREKLAPKLILNEAVATEADYRQRLRIPYVEVWYPEPIPLSAVQSCIFVFPSKPVRCLRLKANNDGFTELDRAIDEIEALIVAGAIKIFSVRDRFMAQIHQSC